MLFTAAVPVAQASYEVVIDKDDQSILPIASGLFSLHPYSFEIPAGMCVASNSIAYTVSFHPYWQSVRGPTPVHLIAWTNGCDVLWSREYSSWEQVLYDIATDDSNLYVTGTKSGEVYLGSYDLMGQNTWNTTWDWSGILPRPIIGREVCLLGDGSIVVAGSSDQSSDNPEFFFLVAFSQSGQYQWHKMYNHYPSICCDLTHLYVLTNQSLQKIDTNGSVIWSTDIHAPMRSCVFGQTIYAYNHQSKEHKYRTSLDIVSWDATSGAKLGNRNLSLCNSEGVTYNSTGMHAATSHDGALIFLLGAEDIGKWYLDGLDPAMQMTSHTCILNQSWNSPRLGIGADSLIRLAGFLDDAHLALAIFNPDQLAETVVTVQEPADSSAGTTDIHDDFTTNHLLHYVSLIAITAEVVAGIAIVSRVKRNRE